MKVLLVPLDDRPCTCDFPLHMAGMVGFTPVMPPRDLMGKYRNPGEPRRLMSWIRSAAPGAEAAIISLDMMIYGGLIASRDMRLSNGEVDLHAGDLEEWLRGNPVKTIYGFNVLMRNMPTFTSAEIVAGAPQFRKLLQKLYEISLKTPHKLQDAIASAEKKLTGEIRGEYFRARERNHRVNKKALEWMKRQYLDYLIIGMDDVVSRGLNLHEKKLLEEIITRHQLTGISLYPGTDEMAMMLLARLACRHFGCYPSIYTIYSSERGKKLTPLYEDRNVEDLVSSYIRMLGGVQVSRLEEADIVLCVHALPGGQAEAVWQSVRKTARHRLLPFVRKIRDLLDSGLIVAVADTAYANGADCALAEELVRHVKIPELSGYAAWNTAGNTLGTTISHATLRWLSLQFRSTLSDPLQAEKAHHRFLFSRFVDDWLYQSGTRRTITDHCQKSGLSPYDLEGDAGKISHMIDGMLIPQAAGLFHKAFAGRFRLPEISSQKAVYSIEGPFTCQAKLPWPRIFEIEVECDFALECGDRLLC